jgi:hypothetical protein
MVATKLVRYRHFLEHLKFHNLDGGCKTRWLHF